MAEDGVEAQLDPKIDVVVVGTGDDANRELLLVGLELMKLTHSIVLKLFFVSLLVFQFAICI